MTGIERVVTKAGSPSEVAKRLSEERKCSRQLVEYWVRQGYVTGKWAPIVSRLFDVSLSDLNPAIYPRGFRAAEVRP